MVLAEDLRQAVLQAALQGKLTEQLETDSDVDEMLVNIQNDKEARITNGYIKGDKRLITTIIDEEEAPFAIPINWRWTTLGSIVYKLTDGTHKTPKYTTNGVKFISVKNISAGVLDLSETKYISQEEHDELYKRCNPEKGDMLLSKIGTTGVPAIVNTEEKFSLFVSVALLKYSHQFINETFLYYLLLSPLVQEQARENTRGVGNKNWVLDFIVKTVIPLPPIEEQQRIVDKINEIMPKIDEYEKIEKELEALKKEFPTDMKDALLQAAMQGKLTEQLESDSSVDELVRKENINPLDEEDYPYFIPENWRFAELGNLTSIPIKRGKSPKYVDKSGILVFAQKCNQKNGSISLYDAKYLDETIKHKYEQDNYLQGDDIVINSTGGGTLGRIGYISEELIKHSLPIVPDSHVTTIRAKDNVLSRYIYFFLKCNQSYLETMGVGSTNQTELRPDAIKELLVPIPPIEEQQRIVERLDALLPLCENLKKE